MIECTVCGIEFPAEEIAVRHNQALGWRSICWDCYSGKNEEAKKGLWKCRLGIHRWHPILTNPKVCYRCGYEWNNMWFKRKGVSRISFKPNWNGILVGIKLS